MLDIANFIPGPLTGLLSDWENAKGKIWKTEKAKCWHNCDWLIEHCWRILAVMSLELNRELKFLTFNSFLRKFRTENINALYKAVRN